MGGWINYNGKGIAHYSLIIGIKSSAEPDETVTRWNFRFENLKDLTILLNANPKDVVKIDDEEMTYTQFREEMLKNAHRIYINSDCELFDMMSKPQPKTF